MFCSVCLVAENVIMCYFWFVFVTSLFGIIKKCRKCQRVDGKVCLILEGFSGFLWFYLNLNFRWIWWLLVDLSI